MGVVRGQRVHEQRGQKGQKQLFDCHQYWSAFLWVCRNAEAVRDIGLGHDGRGGASEDHRFHGHG